VAGQSVLITESSRSDFAVVLYAARLGLRLTISG
jgi:hypothetical protein